MEGGQAMMHKITIMHKDEFEKRKFEFLNRHGSDYTVISSGMKRSGTTNKAYKCADGAEWFEMWTPIFTTQELQINGERVEVELKLMGVEAWTSEGKYSIAYYSQI